MKKSLILFALMGIVLTYTMYEYMGIGADWHHYFYPIVRSYLAGQTHLFDATSEGWYNPPWLLPILVPFMLFPERVGLALFRLMNMIIVAYAVNVFVPRGKSIIWVLLSLSVWDALIIGNVDIIVLLGIVLLYQSLTLRRTWVMGLALVLCLIKPQLSFIPLLVILPSLRNWTKIELLQVTIIPLLALLSSFVIAGWNWPLRFGEVMMNSAPQDRYEMYNISLDSSLYHVAALLNLPKIVPYAIAALLLLGLFWYTRRLKIKDQLAIGMASGPLMVPYTSSPGLALSMIIAWPRLLERKHYLMAGLVYITQFLMVLRGVFGWGISWVLIFFSLSLTLALLFPQRMKEYNDKWDGS